MPPAKTRLTTLRFNEIAKATGGQVFHGENRVELEKAYDAVDKITPQNFKTLTYQPRRELYMFPLRAGVASARRLQPADAGYRSGTAFDASQTRA